MGLLTPAKVARWGMQWVRQEYRAPSSAASYWLESRTSSSHAGALSPQLAVMNGKTTVSGDRGQEQFCSFMSRGKGGGGLQVVRPLRTAASEGRQNILNKQKKNVKLFSQTKRNSINNCDFLRVHNLLRKAITITRSEHQNPRKAKGHKLFYE